MDEFTTIGTKVMTSLRDVDETVNITISFYGGNMRRSKNQIIYSAYRTIYYFF